MRATNEILDLAEQAFVLNLSANQVEEQRARRWTLTEAREAI